MNPRSTFHIDLKTFEPYVDTVRTWLVNLSVAAMAVGIFDDSWMGVPSGLVMLLMALALVYVQKRYMK